MTATIYEPILSREEAAPLIEQELRRHCTTVGHLIGPVQRTVLLNNIRLEFWRCPVGVHFNVYQAGENVMGGHLDPEYEPTKPYSNHRFDPSCWVRGGWERDFAVPYHSYDPHWDDRIPPVLRRTIRKAASSARGSEAAKRVLDLMISYADGTYEDVLECTLNGDEHAGELACWVVNWMRGPNMAAMVPFMMWVNGAPPADVLKAYAEAHHKHGVRRRHLNEILGASERVTKFVAHMVDAPGLERLITTLRSMPSDEAITLVEALAERCSPLVRQVFPEGIDAFFGRFVANPDLNLRPTLAVRRRGLFS